MIPYGRQDIVQADIDAVIDVIQTVGKANGTGTEV